ncbi:MAG: hypothetical protein O7G85_14370 [Planctomycetota bacterium]|nr:hypothetical protein [Planctomycetota bacterium]
MCLTYLGFYVVALLGLHPSWMYLIPSMAYLVTFLASVLCFV